MGNLTPTQNGQTFCLDDLLDGLTCRRRVLGPLGQKRDARGVAALGGQFEASVFGQDGTEELVRDLQHDSGAVTAIGLSSRGTTVLQVQQCGDGLVHNVAAAPAVHIHDHGDTARIVLVGRVVEPGRGVWHGCSSRLQGLPGCTGCMHPSMPSSKVPHRPARGGAQTPGLARWPLSVASFSAVCFVGSRR